MVSRLCFSPLKTYLIHILHFVDSVKPQVLTTNSRLLSLSMARRRNKKGRITPKSNSSCEYPVMLGPTLSNIEESTDVVCGLKRSQSVSLDSVFISSTSKGDSSVHLLTGNSILLMRYTHFYYMYNCRV